MVVVTDPQATAFPASSVISTRTVLSPEGTPARVTGKEMVCSPAAKGQEPVETAKQASPVGRGKDVSVPPWVMVTTVGRLATGPVVKMLKFRVN